jgi:hypothetical protein
MEEKLTLIADSKLYQDMLPDEFYEYLSTIIEEISNPLQQKNPSFNKELVLRFYRNEFINNNELYSLFTSLNFICSKRIKELYSRVYNSDFYNSLDHLIKYDIYKELFCFNYVSCSSLFSYGVKYNGRIAVTKNLDRYIKLDKLSNYLYGIKVKEIYMSMGIVNIMRNDLLMMIIKEDNICDIYYYDLDIVKISSFPNKYKKIIPSKYSSIIIGITETGLLEYIDKNGVRRFNNNYIFKDIKISMHNNFIGLLEDGRVYNSMFLKIEEGKYKKIDICKNYLIGIKEDNSVVTWCINTLSNLIEEKEGKFIKIACGQNHSVGIREDGSVITWGYNNFNQFKNSPTEGKFIKIACGKNHSVGLKEDGSVVTWGDNTEGQYKGSPTENKFVDILCGQDHSLAVTSDGYIVCWGENRKQLNFVEL